MQHIAAPDMSDEKWWEFFKESVPSIERAEKLLKDEPNVRIIKKLYQVQAGKNAHNQTDKFYNWEFEPTFSELSRYFSEELEITENEARDRITELHKCLIIDALTNRLGRSYNIIDEGDYLALSNAGLVYVRVFLQTNQT